MKTYTTNCTESTAEHIDQMVDKSKVITYSELLNNVTQSELDNIFPFYAGIPLSLKSDYAVAFYQSEYKNVPCIYVEHSRIEYIFT